MFMQVCLYLCLIHLTPISDLNILKKVALVDIMLLMDFNGAGHWINSEHNGKDNCFLLI